MKKTFLKTMLAALLLLAPAINAGLPEPGARIYGTVAINGVTVTASDSTIVIEARRTPSGAPIATYRMGSQSVAGNFYSIKLNAESTSPLTNPENSALGATIYLVVRNDAGDVDQKSVTLSQRGLTARVDFGAVDTDGDGLSDAFETLYFGSATGGNAGADSDGDGRPNLREFLQGTNPNVADGRHPADISPADDRLSLKEVTDYILAWKTGGTWPIEPALNSPNIEDYVTRAGAIWKGGEVYVFDNDPVTTAPLWWTNPTAEIAHDAKDKTQIAAAPITKVKIAVERSLGSIYKPNQPAPITLSVTPGDNTKAYAVVETPPTGWTVRNLSHEGRWDEANRKIKWGPFFDATARTLTYEAVPGPASNGAADFTGRGSFDGLGQIADGPARMWTEGLNSGPRLVFATPSANGLALEIVGDAGRRYEILISSDLIQWEPWQTVTLDSQGRAQRSVDPAAGSSFLRLRSLE
jgi:hypothetical protein